METVTFNPHSEQGGDDAGRSNSHSDPGITYGGTPSNDDGSTGSRHGDTSRSIDGEGTTAGGGDTGTHVQDGGANGDPVGGDGTNQQSSDGNGEPVSDARESGGDAGGEWRERLRRRAARTRTGSAETDARDDRQGTPRVVRLRKGSTDEEGSARAGGLGLVVGALFVAVAYMLGDHWRLETDEARDIGKALQDAINSIPDKKRKSAIIKALSSWGPWIGLIGVTAVIVRPRIEESIRQYRVKREEEEREAYAAKYPRYGVTVDPSVPDEQSNDASGSFRGSEFPRPTARPVRRPFGGKPFG